MLWTEKYRPKSVESFEAPAHLKEFLKKGTFPNLLLYGPPGTGKTTFAHLLSKGSVLELNASDERGIAVVRNKIKVYASGISSQKVIILDECENLTPDAQQCLRRVIEDYGSHTRFIFITNYLSKIIGPLKSRLLKIKFECSKENYEYLKKVGEMESLGCDDEFYRNLFAKCRYDLRRSLNVLQGVSPMILKISNEHRNKLIDEFMGFVPEKVVDKFFVLGKEDVTGFIKDFLREGFSFLQFLYQLNLRGVKNDSHRSLLSGVISLLEGRAVLGCSVEIMLFYLCCKKIEIFS